MQEIPPRLFTLSDIERPCTNSIAGDEAQDEADRAARIAHAPSAEWQPNFARAVDMHAALKPGHGSMLGGKKRLSNG